ncbi:MAG: hypothetical protein IE916_05385 [Epsilonproteobacteria bacterium]|nr:hypothetical protein [Campylobacterota bacterium]
MKIAIECRSVLLQKSLEMFLANHLSSSKQSELIIRDMKVASDPRSFYISSDADADLIKPFSRSQLILALENRLKKSTVHDSHAAKHDHVPMNFEILEKRIELLTKEYQENILKAVKAFYE